MSERAATRSVFLVVLALGAIVLLPCAVAQSTSNSPIPSDSEIRQMLVDRIDKERQSVGIVVGVVEPTGRRVVAYGSLDKSDKRPVDGNTVFESARSQSIYLIAAGGHGAARRGRINRSCNQVPSAGNQDAGARRTAITLQDLATHTSGLPRLPSNLAPKDPANPYADYSVEQLYQFLSSYQLTRDIGSQYEYSNLGGGLLGTCSPSRWHGLRDVSALAHLRTVGHEEHRHRALRGDEGAICGWA